MIYALLTVTVVVVKHMVVRRPRCTLKRNSSFISYRLLIDYLNSSVGAEIEVVLARVADVSVDYCACRDVVALSNLKY